MVVPTVWRARYTVKRAYRAALLRHRIKLAHPCKACGERDTKVLTFHHRDRATKSREVSMITSRKSLMREVAKCDVLCWPCHCALHKREREATHATDGK